MEDISKDAPVELCIINLCCNTASQAAEQQYSRFVPCSRTHSRQVDPTPPHQTQSLALSHTPPTWLMNTSSRKLLCIASSSLRCVLVVCAHTSNVIEPQYLTRLAVRLSICVSAAPRQRTGLERSQARATTSSHDLHPLHYSCVRALDRAQSCTVGCM